APYDRDGANALRGVPHADAVRVLRGRLDAQRAARRSLGTGDELLADLPALASSRSPHDLLASVVDALAATIADAVAPCAPARVLLAGGSVRNAALVKALRERLAPIPVEPTDALGVPASHREAACFAVLGALCADRTPITLPAITGAPAPAPISGAWVDPRRQP